MINRLIETSGQVEVQETAFSTDVLGRYICSTWDEAANNGGIPFDVVVIGAGMFGAYCAEKIYRYSNLRVLVLEAGSFLVSEHVQNLARIGLNAAGAVQVASNGQDPGPRERVWGIPWRSQVRFPGLAYCLGGRSLYWGGWSPRLTENDLKSWPPAIAGYLQSPTKTKDAYEATERETGVFDTTDFISGDLYKALRKKFQAVRTSVPTVDAIEEAPLAVQAAPPASGLFSFDKYSSAPILIDAIRQDAANPDWRRRLFLVPRTHVVKLHVTGNAVTTIEAFARGQQKFLNISPNCAVVLASGTIETTRLALESFPTSLMGRNLMAHLRSNTVVRIKRDAIDPAFKNELEAAALLVRGSTPQGRYHLQVTAAAIGGADSEATMFRAVPDLDLLEKMLAAQSSDGIVVTLRGIGEMQGSKEPNAATLTGSPPSWMDLSDQTDEFGMRRAWVNIVPTPADNLLWNVMDQAAQQLAMKLANDDPSKIEFLTPNKTARDGLGTTHHESGTLWMGDDPTRSVTNLDGRLHHISNAYVAGPALFPTLGSANPSLTALTLARRTAQVIARQALSIDSGFEPLGSGGLDGWRMAGFGGFMELGGDIIESVDGIGLLWYTKAQFQDFVLKLDWRASNWDDNSGVFVRIPALGSSDPANDWKPAVTQGYEIQIDNTGKNPDTAPPTFDDPLHRTGAIYTLAPSNAAPAVGQWHRFEIEAASTGITVNLDGQQVSQLPNGNRNPKGYIGLQNHHPGSRVQFRNVQIKKL